MVHHVGCSQLHCGGDSVDPRGLEDGSFPPDVPWEHERSVVVADSPCQRDHGPPCCSCRCLEDKWFAADVCGLAFVPVRCAFVFVRVVRVRFCLFACCCCEQRLVGLLVHSCYHHIVHRLGISLVRDQYICNFSFSPVLWEGTCALVLVRRGVASCSFHPVTYFFRNFVMTFLVPRSPLARCEVETLPVHDAGPLLSSCFLSANTSASVSIGRVHVYTHSEP